MKSYKDRLKEIRIDNDYTQADVAAFLNDTQTHYSLKERTPEGTRDFTPNEITKLCKLYRVSADYILGLTDKK